LSLNGATEAEYVIVGFCVVWVVNKCGIVMMEIGRIFDGWQKKSVKFEFGR
jgi:hypothetical protein